MIREVRHGPPNPRGLSRLELEPASSRSLVHRLGLAAQRRGHFVAPATRGLSKPGELTAHQPTTPCTSKGREIRPPLTQQRAEVNL